MRKKRRPRQQQLKTQKLVNWKTTGKQPLLPMRLTSKTVGMQTQKRSVKRLPYVRLLMVSYRNLVVKAIQSLLKRCLQKYLY